MTYDYYLINPFIRCRSGSVANLLLAINIAKLGFKPKNRVMFAFWGAEELGLLGSSHYVSSLSEEERKMIALNINFDMIVSYTIKTFFS